MLLNTLNTHDLAKLVMSWTPEGVQLNSLDLSLEQLAFVTTLLNEGRDPDWQEKLKGLFSGLSETPQLQSIAKELSPPQFLTLLTFSHRCDEKQKLPPLFIAMPVDTFQEILLTASDEELELLKKECVTEPVQLQLLHLMHGLSADLQNLFKFIEILQKEIDGMSVINVNPKEIISLLSTIKQISLKGQLIWEAIDKGLSLVWATERTDLIQKFSALKEKSQRCVYTQIGNPRDTTTAPSGLYNYLEEHLYTLYSSYYVGKDLYFEDSDPAIEAISALEIWSLKDYIQVGLLDPNTRLELSSTEYSEEEQLAYQRKLFDLAKKKLASLGLITLNDLKKAWLFSKEMLIEYIRNPWDDQISKESE